MELERRVRRRGDLAEVATDLQPTRPDHEAELILDLAGAGADAQVPVLSVAFDRGPLRKALTALFDGRVPVVEVIRDGSHVVARAVPMVDSKVLVAACMHTILARTVTLMVATVRRFAAGVLPAGEAVDGLERGQAPSMRTLIASLGQRLVRVARQRLGPRREHWRVGYRYIDGPGVAETGSLRGTWRELPDDGERFYADPFPFIRNDRTFLFVEDFPYATRKAVISVVELDDAGGPGAPRVVLEEPHHLSYPQVFERHGEVWMIPESMSGRQVVLYRADPFPDRWVRHSVLIDDCELSDATLLEHGGRLWLFASDRDGYGSASDTLVLFHADRLEGPWRPHVMNPVLIDRACGRPGGAVIRQGERLLLPLQDGTTGYGGRLGLAEILELSETAVRLSPPRPIANSPDWPYDRYHTLNRVGRLEVVDGW